MTETVLQVDHLTKRYGSLTAVKDLTLRVCAGEVFGFLGPNGAGKTTSIRMICGLLKPDSGQVRIRGQELSSNPAISMRVGVCPQEIVLWGKLTCLEQLVYVGQLYNLPAARARTRGTALLEDLGLTEKRNCPAQSLSGGMQRRLNLALALVHDPELIVLDEPEAGLDPQSRVHLREYIRSLASQKTVILTTHNMDEADRAADRIAIIDHGELLAEGTPQELKHSRGEGDIIEISLKDPGAGSDARLALASLRELTDQVEVRCVNGDLAIRALNAAGLLPAVLGRLSQAGIPYGEVHLRENTLEDVFIQLTGRRLRE